MTPAAPTATLRAVVATLDFDRVETRGVVKLYGATRALAGVSLAFEAGTVTAIEGPNGSGKSTLLQLLALLARPTRGEVRFGGHTLRSAGPELRARLGVLAHAPMLYADLSGEENLRLAAQLHALPHAATTLAAMQSRFALGGWLQRQARTLSRGQLQRLALARALLHAPRLLLLDEPTTGLDARSTERLAGVVREERERGAIVVLITHDPAFAAELADRRVRLERGRVVEAA